jgi:hypothetical protein
MAKVSSIDKNKRRKKYKLILFDKLKKKFEWFFYFGFSIISYLFIIEVYIISLKDVSI